MFEALMQNRRTLYAFVFCSCFALLATGYFMQYFMNLEPCPLCLVQRFFFYSVGIIALIGLIHGAAGIGNKLYSGLMALFALGGATVAARQLWLQSLPPDQIPSCVADFDFIINNFPILKAAETLWHGSPSCAEVTWRFLGLSIAGWAFIWFVIFVIVALIQMFRSFKTVA